METIYGITVYRPNELMKLDGLPVTERQSNNGQAEGGAILTNAGYVAGHLLVRYLLDLPSLVGQLVKTEQGLKFELYPQPTGDDGKRLNHSQMAALLEEMKRKYFGIRFVYRNNNGLMLVITPLKYTGRMERAQVTFGNRGPKLVMELVKEEAPLTA